MSERSEQRSGVEDWRGAAGRPERRPARRFGVRPAIALAALLLVIAWLWRHLEF